MSVFYFGFCLFKIRSLVYLFIRLLHSPCVDGGYVRMISLNAHIPIVVFKDFIKNTGYFSHTDSYFSIDSLAVYFVDIERCYPDRIQL